MFTTHFRALAVFVVMASLPASAQVVQGNKVLWDVCGGEGERACNTSDPAFSLLPDSGNSVRCDRTLDPRFVDGTPRCVNAGRRTQIPGDPYRPVGPFLTPQLDDQAQSIAADLPLNFSSLFGTHNSYSNREDGNGSAFNGDQAYTISDQLGMRANYVRLDAWVATDGQLILCHASDLIDSFTIAGKTVTIPTGPSFCDADIQGATSFHRPPFYAIKEIAYFLKRNPQTFLVMRLNDGFGTTANDLRVPIDKELGEMVYKNPFNNITDRATLAKFRWPTLRQFREMTPAKQILIIGANESDYVWSWTKFVMDDGYTDAYGFKSNCNNKDGYAVNNVLVGPYFGDYKNLPRTAEKFTYIGEDRSLSNFFNIPPPGAGLLHAADIATSLNCGFGLINIDFLNALFAAPKVSIGFKGISSVGIPDVEQTFIDYTDGGGIDLRPANFVWSYLSGEVPFAGPVLFASGTANQHWLITSDANSPLPYACAGPKPGQSFPNPDNPWSYDWRVTTRTGGWAGGEDACQAELGTGYHFWHPMSAIENNRLQATVVSSPTDKVWINHYYSKVTALPQSVGFTINTNQASTESRTIVISGGHGGKLSATFQPVDSRWGQFVDITRTGSNTFVVKPNSKLNSFGAGNFVGSVVISEINPGDGETTLTGTTISIKQTTNAVLAVSPAVLDFQGGLTQTVSLKSATTPIALSLSTTPLPAWLKVQLHGTTTPTTATFTADPSKISITPGFGLGGAGATVTFVPADSNISEQSVSATATVVQQTVDTKPTGLSMTVDGVAITTPQKLNWIAGSFHQMFAAQQLAGANHAVYQFGSWSNGAPLVNSVAPSAPTSYIASYDTLYPLTVTASPSAGGTVTVTNPQPNNLYLLGQVALLQPVPAPGYVFRDFSGDLAGSITPGTVPMVGPKTVQANFILKTGQVKLVTNPPGLPVVVDGITYSTPMSFNWDLSSHNVQAPPTSAGDATTRYVFTNWDDGTATTARAIPGSPTDVRYTANYGTQYLIDVTVTPSAAGTVTGGGWINAGAVTTLNATAAPGFKFVGYTGALTSASASFTLPQVNASRKFIATFAGIGTPFLYAASGTRTDLGNDLVNVPIVLTNAGAGPAGDATITSITGLVATQGGGAVSAPLPAGGLTIGTIFTGKTAQGMVQFNWPAAATRIQFTVHYSANSGTYQGSNTISLFR